MKIDLDNDFEMRNLAYMKTLKDCSMDVFYRLTQKSLNISTGGCLVGPESLAVARGPEKEHAVDLFKSLDQSDVQYSFGDFLQDLEGPKAPILDLISSQVWKLHGSPDVEGPVSGRNCRCRSVWCPECFPIFYSEKLKRLFSTFDWQKTRQVVLTVNPDLFESPVEALADIRGKRLIGEFVKRLRRGVRHKVGRKFEWKFKPVRIIRWAWFLEWHKNGFPHYHVFMQTDKTGSYGKIGADFIRDSWRLSSWVKESFCESESHFHNLTGYYAGKGYFEKGKEHQGRLPQVIMEQVKGKILRFRSSEPREKREKREIPGDIQEQINFHECENYFERMGRMEDITDEDTREMTEELTAIGLRKRRDVNYTVLLQGCGQKTYIDLDIGRYRVTAICNMPIQEWKDRTNRHYVQNCGYVARLSGFEIMQLLEKLERIVSIRKYQDIGHACAERERQVEKFEKDQRHYWKTVMMQD